MKISSSEPVVNELDAAIREAMQNLNRIERLQDSPLLAYGLIRQRQVDDQLTSYEALRAIFDEVLVELRQQNADYADLLHGRFWEGLQVKKMVIEQRPAPWSESSFYNHQHRALQQFTLIFKEREALTTSIAAPTDAIALHQAESPHSLPDDDRPLAPLVGQPLPEPTTPSLVVPSLGAVQRFILSLPQSTIASSVLLLIALTGLLWLFLSYRLESNRSSAASGPMEEIAKPVCGETQRIEIATQPRFVAGEGVSLFTRETMPGGVLSNFVRAVKFDNTGLWLGYHAADGATGGLSHFNKATWANCNSQSGLVDKNINTIARDAYGRLWLTAEQAGGVMMFDGTTWHTYTVADGLPTNDTFSITFDAEENVWIGTYQGVAKYDGHRWTVPYSQANHTIFSNHVHTLAFDREQGIWIGHHDAGISYLAAGSVAWQHITAPQELGSANVRHILATTPADGETNSVWVATDGGGLSHFDGKRWATYTMADGLPSNQIYYLAEDKYQRIWAATSAGVVYRQEDKWLTYHALPAVSIAFSPVQCATCPYDDDHVVTGTIAHGFTHSRLPYPTPAVEITQTCFYVDQERGENANGAREELCVKPQVTAEDHYQVRYPKQLAPGNKVRVAITVHPLAPYKLQESRGDFLANLSDDEEARFGAHTLMPVQGTVEPGEPFIFTSFDDPLLVPTLDASLPLTITSSWRVWMHTRYTGPVLDVILPVVSTPE